MSKLHELLAVEGDLQKLFLQTNNETKATFEKKTEHFRGHNKTLSMRDEERQFEEAAADEHKELVSTVEEKLDYSAITMREYFDALLQKEATNQEARADLTVDDVVIGSNLPATFLLGLESRLKTIRDMYASIPTLPPGVKWEPDKNMREGVFVAVPDEKREKTEKDVVHDVVVQPTAQHPAQVSAKQVVKTVGIYTDRKWCGMITSGQKSSKLARIDGLIQATKQARMRANCQEVNHGLAVGAAIENYIRKD